ncbi:hypothetical protein SLEP1_g41504 [Rubroshorea leprosula]|uniref:non-specific serine/threonine protein kinase n=1 Tax=Rubroshorea leprosula TaxID=152421 RepID=A0AAV5L6R0_9ROSI|nr:hypothetical protein SLEP1_g41504 [Rubroshorea leprosula]
MADCRSLCFLAAFYAAVISMALAQDQNEFIFNGFSEGSNLHLDGLATIHPDGLLQLTNTSMTEMGHAFHRFPLQFNRSSNSAPSYSFSTCFVFAMVPESPSLSGHGIAFVISPSRDFSQALAGRYLGLFNTSTNGRPTNHVLAVEFDTIYNPDFDNIKENHVGIDVNDLKSNVWIDYDEEEGLLNVTLAPITSLKPDWPLLSISIDLSEIFLDEMYVGFSAATGSSAASDHYILGWSFSKNGKAQSLEISQLPHLPTHDGESKRREGLVIILLVAVVALATIYGAGYLFWRRKYSEVHEEWEREYGPQRFSYKTLYQATRGFKEKQLLGSGGFGKVYRGTLPSSTAQIAVKRISHDSKQGMKQFVAEIVSMGRLRHRNLVQLLGYCRRKGELLLVYDYMPNGSLDTFLFSNGRPLLTWSQRYRILRDVASALLYLHEEWEQVVLHRDVKASNVLLDSNLNGRLGDFGLARLHDHGAKPGTTNLVGTIGYLAPELTRTGMASTSTDVFAFGAFLLEVACGRRPIEQWRQAEEVFLVESITKCWKRGAIFCACDPRLEGNFPVEEMELVLKLGLLCSQSQPSARPSMRQVLQYLNGNTSLPDFSPENIENGMAMSNNQAFSDFIKSFPSNSHSSTDSILNNGR